MTRFSTFRFFGRYRFARAAEVQDQGQSPEQ